MSLKIVMLSLLLKLDSKDVVAFRAGVKMIPLIALN